MMTIMKTDCNIIDLEKLMSMDALTVYNYALNIKRKQCYEAAGMRTDE